MKQFTTYISAAICCLTINAAAFAQDNSSNTQQVLHGNELSYSAATHRIQPLSEDGKPIYLNDINTKVISDFKKRFVAIDNERWYKQPDAYVAIFKRDGVDCMVRYNRKGRWESILKGYKEELMPFTVRHIVKSIYYDYTITYVNEIETTNSKGIPTYLVYTRYKNLIKIFRISNGEMDIWQEMKQQQ